MGWELSSAICGTTRRVIDCAGKVVLRLLVVLPVAGGVTATAGPA
jgi:hypothetical protein